MQDAALIVIGVLYAVVFLGLLFEVLSCVEASIRDLRCASGSAWRSACSCFGGLGG